MEKQPFLEHEPLPKAADYLLTSQEVTDLLEQAVDDGNVKVEPVDDTSQADFWVAVQATESEIVLSPDLEGKGHRYFVPGEYAWANDNKVVEEAEEVRLAALRHLSYKEAPWYLTDRQTSQKIDDGEPLSQAVELALGDQRLEILNFSTEHKLSRDQIDKLRQTLEKTANAIGPQIFDDIAGVAILPDADMGKDTVGLYSGTSRVVKLSDRLLWDESLSTDKYGLDDDATRLETTFAHELSHGGQRGAEEVYSDALSWQQSSYYDVVDDYGNLRSGTRHLRGKPAEMQPVFENGRVVEKPAIDVFTQKDIETAAPNTAYGSTTGGEDFAEASVPYIFTGRQTDKIDTLRANAISATYTKKHSGESPALGPYVVEAHEVDLKTTSKQTMHIEPRSYKVAVSVSITD